jgi:hypothetical protein
MADPVPKHTGPISFTDTHLEPSISRRQVGGSGWGKSSLSFVSRLRKSVVYMLMDKQMFAAICVLAELVSVQ